MMKTCDLVIIGAGPAGMAAATLAAKHGASVTVLDEQPDAGGQIYRNIAQATPAQARVLGPDYMAGAAVLDAFNSQTIDHVKSATVWDVTQNGQVAYSIAGTAHRVQGKYILVATGALERPVPVKGWTKTGVMMAGAAQIMMKTARLVPQQAVLAGAGPLLYLVAAQMIAAGTPPLALVETSPTANTLRATRHLGGAFQGRHAIANGLRLLHRIRKAGVKRYKAARDIEILGDTQTRGIRFRCANQTHELQCATVLLHSGVVPNTQITRSLRLDHLWNDAQRCFHPIRNSYGMTSARQIYVAGDGAGIGGAKSAYLAGQVAACDILLQLKIVTQETRDTLSGKPRAALRRDLAIRPFLDALYAPADHIVRPADDVIICRCEEVTAGEIRAHAKSGCIGPNQTKAFSRAGMGPCQARYCGLTVTELLAEAHNLAPDVIGAHRIRAPLKPVTLGEIAALADAGNDHGPDEK